MRATQLDHGVGGMVLKIAHQVVRTSCSRGPRRSAGDPHESPKNKKWVSVNLVANCGSTDGEVTTRGARVPARRPSRGAQPVPGDAGNGERTDARQGAIRIFSETPFPPQRSATHHSGFTRCAIPRTVPSRETPRTHSPFRGPRLRKIAHQVSWGSAPVRWRQAVGAGVGTRMAG
jgi:hypothetical protein